MLCFPKVADENSAKPRPTLRKSIDFLAGPLKKVRFLVQKQHIYIKKEDYEKIVITGGPCAGKTTCLRATSEEFGDQVVVLPEAATILLEGGFPMPGRDLIWSQEWQVSFQAAVLGVQKEMEVAYEIVAKKRGCRILICDRGLLDGAAYWPGGLEPFTNHFGLYTDACRSQYAAIIHIESLATADPGNYGNADNEQRFETVEEARERELATRQAWQDHPAWVFISGRRDVGAKISEVLGIIRFLLATTTAE